MLLQEIQNNQFFTTYEETKNWLDRKAISDYSINPKTLEVDVNGTVNLRSNCFNTIPVKFNHVTGDFLCTENRLKSLKGAPFKVDGNFACYYNALTSLHGCPSYIGESLICTDNKLTSLEGGPQYVGKDFRCNNNELTSLQGAPQIIEEDFYCHYNKLISLQGCPAIIKKEFIFDANNQTMNNINKFVKSVKYITLSYPPRNLKGLMQLFLIKDIEKILTMVPDNEIKQVINIINKHLSGDRSGPACQIELIDAGLGKYIKL